MSYVTTVVIVAEHAPREVIELLARGFDDGTRVHSFPAVPNEVTGGSKGLTGSVFVAGCNYLPRDAFLAWVRALPWLPYDDGSTWGQFPNGGVVVTLLPEQGNPAVEPIRPDPSTGLTPGSGD